VDVKVLNRRICSYKMVEVPRDAYVVTEEEQDLTYTDIIRHDAVAILRLGYTPLLF
jgi:hypothetical protein